MEAKDKEGRGICYNSDPMQKTLTLAVAAFAAGDAHAHDLYLPFGQSNMTGVRAEAMSARGKRFNAEAQSHREGEPIAKGVSRLVRLGAALLPLALAAATGDDAQVSVSRMQPSVARQQRPAAITDEATYLKWKWRMDVSDPRTGLDNAALKAGVAKVAAEFEDKEPWAETSARMFAYLADNMAVGFSKHDCFPAIAAWNRWDRPLGKVLGRRSGKIDERFSPGLRREIKALHDSGRGRADWKDFDHSAPDWERILALGFTGMKARVDGYAADTPFYRSEKSAAETILRFVRRLLATAKAHPDADAPLMRKEIASLERLASGPPQTCFDVMEFTMIYFILSEHVNRFQVRTLGNIDKTWWPYYRADLAAGRTTEAAFREEFRHFIWQFGSIDNYWGHPMYLGGTRRDGTTEYNPLSEIILDVIDREALPTPKFQVKLAANTPEPIWRKALDMLRRHRSLVLMSERGMADSMKPLGLSDDERRDLLVWGCYEYIPRGTGNCTSGFRLNMLQPILDLLRRAAEGGDAPATFADFLAAYKRELNANADWLMRVVNESESHLSEIHPALVLSLAIDSALERGVDAFSTGMTHNFSAVGEVGFASAVDSLLAVKDVVYDRRELPLGEFGRIVAADWKGHEELRLRILRGAPKWGRGMAAADDLAAEVLEAMTSHIVGKPNGRGGKWTVYGLHSRAYIEFGRDSPASPDGRRKGEHLSKNVAPSVGAETEGITGTLRSYAKIRPENFPCGSVLDVMINPATVRGEEGLVAFRALVQHWMDNGGTALNVNIVSADELRDAQRHPERYENLQVRVAGWNVRWIDIPKREQDDFIARAESIAR